EIPSRRTRSSRSTTRCPGRSLSRRRRRSPPRLLPRIRFPRSVEAPDYFEPTVGWRAWLVVQTPEGLRLSSVLYPTVWMPRQEEVAVCRPDATGRDLQDPPPHAAPHPRC